MILLTPLVVLSLTGCGPTYAELRVQGQEAMLRGEYGTARRLFLQAEDRWTRQVENLHDLGACSVLLAREDFVEMNRAAAMREVDAAIAYYSRAIERQPANKACLEGKRVALQLKGQFDEALKHEMWVAKFVGPSAEQFVYLARELERRGDIDGAYLRYRQAVAMEPDDPGAHAAFAKFLLEHGNESAALQHLQTAYKLDPGNAWVRDELTTRGALASP
ncbi:MAG TPA: tetratricopeptide repeat protein [Phycisphaerae bacterium]|nr:tetratricopeptide repeat protein [Phycisphaerae bacterium]HNU46967.1 tetratricopeptide repeat protein [Phycisphaerae bacterium]